MDSGTSPPDLPDPLPVLYAAPFALPRPKWYSVARSQKPSTHARESLEAVRAQFEALGQGHVFAFWSKLDDAGRAALLAQTERLAPGLAGLLEAGQQAIDKLGKTAAAQAISPVDAVALPENGGSVEQRERARQRGEALLAEGRMAAFVVAGGQGTRLGFPGPKGCFPVGPVSKRTLFEVQAQKIRGLARKLGRAVPWFIMTSPATDEATRAFFAREQNFGIAADDLHVFRQDTVPSLDLEGRLMLESPERLVESPNGHGGALTALVESGAVDQMERRGIDTIFYYQVDNPLVQIGDPTYLGLHEEAGAEFSCKVVRKREPFEKVGLVAQIGERIGIVEYTELDPERARERDEQGQLRYWAGNIAVHLLRTAFVRRVAANADTELPYHASAKKIATVDAQGRPLAPDAPNGYKLERFVFDALASARKVCVVETSAAEDFSPIKNAEGTDSPATARRDLSAQARRWLASAGIEIPEAHSVEIDHSHIDSAEDAQRAGFRDLAEAQEVAQLAPEMKS